MDLSALFHSACLGQGASWYGASALELACRECHGLLTGGELPAVTTAVQNMPVVLLDGAVTVLAAAVAGAVIASSANGIAARTSGARVEAATVVKEAAIPDRHGSPS